MSQEKLKEILIALQDNESESPNTKRQFFLYALAEINKIVMECVPKEIVTKNSGYYFMDNKKGFNKAIAEFKANWEGK